MSIKCRYAKDNSGSEKFDKENYYEVEVIDSWGNSSVPQNGLLLKHSNEQTKFFKGQFQNGKIKSGKMKVYDSKDNVKLEYTGDFRKNLMDGEGVMEVPSKYKYEGSFREHMFDGIGKETDETKGTVYIGQFERNMRHGYGELTYQSRDDLKLVGFWDNGHITTEEGVYVRKDGGFQALEEV
jgi:hypothetical protein